MIFGFINGLLVGYGLAFVFDMVFFDSTVFIKEYSKCSECNNFYAVICKDCSTELSKR